MKLFVAEVHDDSGWMPKLFWIGSLRLALRAGLKPEYRVRRVMSRDEADQLAPHVSYWGSELGEPWDLDAFEWEWPATRTP